MSNQFDFFDYANYISNRINHAFLRCASALFLGNESLSFFPKNLERLANMSSAPSRKNVVNAIDPGGPHGCDSKPFRINYSLTRTPPIILACFSHHESST